MSDYQQMVRDVIAKAVNHEIPIFQAAAEVETIIMTELDGSKQ